MADNYDVGGEGVAYHDLDAVNNSGAYRPAEGVDTEPATDALPPGLSAGASGVGYNVGHISAGEWLKYTVNVPTAGAYSVGLRFASGSSGGSAHLEIDGTNVSGSIGLPGTGGWQSWQTITTAGLSFTAGTHTLRLVFDTSAAGGDVGNLGWLHVAAATNPVAPAWPTSWVSAAAAPSPRFEPIAHSFGGKVYAFGGFKDSSWHVDRTYVSYDPSTNTWKSLGTLPVGMAETHVGVADDGTYMYFAGGFAGDLQQGVSPSQIASDKVWRYDPAANTWSLLTTLPFARGAGQLVCIGRTLHYIGGNPADRVTNIGDHLVLNLDNPSAGWTTAAPMTNPKDHFSAAVMNGKIYLLGGEHGHDVLHQQQSDMQVYDPATDQWTALANLPIAKSHMEGGTFVENGEIIFAGGQIDNFNSTNRVFAYDPSADAWTELAPLPAYRQGGIVMPFGNKIVVTLGAVSTNAPQSATWIGTLPSTTSAVRSLAITPAAGATAAPGTGATTGGVVKREAFSLADDGSIIATNLASGAVRLVARASSKPFAGTGGAIDVLGKKLYVFGGTGLAAGRVQIFNTGTRRWTVGKSMPFASAGGAAVGDVAGKIYVAGGIVAGQVTANVARFNPVTGTWTRLANLPVARTDLYASSDGRKLYFSAGQAGGADGTPTGTVDDAVQIFDPKVQKWSAEGAPGWPAHPPGCMCAACMGIRANA